MAFCARRYSRAVGNRWEDNIFITSIVESTENIPHKPFGYNFPYNSMTIRNPNKKGDKVIVE